MFVAACGSRTDLGGKQDGAGGSASSSSSSSTSTSSSGAGGIGGSGGTGGTGGSGAGGYCGNGLVDPGEQCDDGNGSNNDSCKVNCSPAYCGDGVLWYNVEQCDDGNFSSNDSCVAGCQFAYCGDGYLWFGLEECDDGNPFDGDGCSSFCQLQTCGDGILDFGEQCDLGPQNQDRPAFALLQSVFAEQAVWPMDRSFDAVAFYGYSSASSHTGYEELLQSRLFLYRDLTTGELSLFMHHGIDFNSSGQNQPQGKVVFDIQNLPGQVYVSVADDQSNEFSKNSPSGATGNWSFNKNSDGGVLSGFPFPGNWSIAITPQFDPSINGWGFVNGDELLYFLSMSEPLILTAYNSPSPCRTNCTIPVCGDGILDGGEVCDDGNNVNGDGCSANCLAAFP